ncbi:50S ribosomal protein L33 [Shouchella xiaoxiensis]|nr:50S ribosomal protein L33 [Shouchella xiaoxiensis]
MSLKRILACELCHSRNYSYSTEKISDARLEVKKYCKRCNEHTIHSETK